MKSYFKSLFSVTTMATRLCNDQVSRTEIITRGALYIFLVIYGYIDLFLPPFNINLVIPLAFSICFILLLYFLNTRLDGKHFFRRLFCLYVPIIPQAFFLIIFLIFIGMILWCWANVSSFVRQFLSSHYPWIIGLVVLCMMSFYFLRMLHGFSVAAGKKSPTHTSRSFFLSLVKIRTMALRIEEGRVKTPEVLFHSVVSVFLFAKLIHTYVESQNILHLIVPVAYLVIAYVTNHYGDKKDYGKRFVCLFTTAFVQGTAVQIGYASIHVVILYLFKIYNKNLLQMDMLIAILFEFFQILQGMRMATGLKKIERNQQ